MKLEEELHHQMVKLLLIVLQDIYPKILNSLTLLPHYLRVAELGVKNNKIKNKYTKAIEYDGGITFLYKHKRDHQKLWNSSG